MENDCPPAIGTTFRHASQCQLVIGADGENTRFALAPSVRNVDRQPNRIATERACAPNPSASAKVTAAGPMRRNAA